MTNSRKRFFAGVLVFGLALLGINAATLPSARTQSGFANVTKTVSSFLPSKEDFAAEFQSTFSNQMQQQTQIMTKEAMAYAIPVIQESLPPQALHGAFAAIAIWNEFNAIKSFCNGEMTRTDLALVSLTNLAEISATMFVSATPYIVMAFTVIESSRDILQLVRKGVNSPEEVIEAIAHIGGIAAGTWAAATTISALTSATAASEMRGGLSSFVASPVGGAIIGGLTFAVVYSITSAFIRVTGQAIVNKYDCYSDPERFDRICDEISGKLHLPKIERVPEITAAGAAV